MYTKLDDAKHARRINAYIKTNPNATKKLVIENCITTAYRLKYLELQGLITLPPPTPRGKRNEEYYHGR